MVEVDARKARREGRVNLGQGAIETVLVVVIYVDPAQRPRKLCPQHGGSEVGFWVARRRKQALRGLLQRRVERALSKVFKPARPDRSIGLNGRPIGTVQVVAI